MSDILENQSEEQQQLQPSEQQPKSKQESTTSQSNDRRPQHQHQLQRANNYHGKHRKQTFSRIPVDPSKRYTVPLTRESWGPGCKGKKFRKEKGKKKRCGTSGQRIDGSIKSVRLDSRQ